MRLRRGQLRPQSTQQHVRGSRTASNQSLCPRMRLGWGERLPTSVCASHRKRSWSIRLPCLGYHLFFTIGYAPSGCPWAFLIAQCSSSIAKRLEIVRRFFIFVIYFFGFLSPFSLFAKFKSGGHNSLSVIGLQLASWQLVPGVPTCLPVAVASRAEWDFTDITRDERA